MAEHTLRMVICTTPDDVPRVEPIAELLRSPARRSVWIIHDEPGGLPWWESVVDEIRQATLFIVALSPAALDPTSSTGTMVAAALAFARACEHECLVVSVADVEAETLPAGIDHGADRGLPSARRHLGATAVPEVGDRRSARAASRLGGRPPAPRAHRPAEGRVHLVSPGRHEVGDRPASRTDRGDTRARHGLPRHRVHRPGRGLPAELATGIDRADVILVLIGSSWLEKLNKRPGGRSRTWSSSRSRWRSRAASRWSRCWSRGRHAGPDDLPVDPAAGRSERLAAPRRPISTRHQRDHRPARVHSGSGTG